MTDFIYPLATVLLNFICVLVCIRLAVTRRAFWLIPMFMSLSLLVGSGVCLLAAASNIAGETLSAVASYVSIFLFAVSTIWTITIIAFSTVTKADKAEAEARRAKAEAEYVNDRTNPVRPAADPRPIAASAITPYQAVKLASKPKTRSQDMYLAGPVPTVSLRKSAFMQEEA